MTTTDTNQIPGTRGATKRSWRAVSTRDLLAGIIRDNPKASDAQLLQLYDDAIRENEAYLASVIEYAFVNDLNAYRKGLRSGEPSSSAPTEKETKAKEEAREKAREATTAVKEATAAKVRDTVEKVAERKAQIVMLDLMMPNGLALRECTGADCRKLGPRIGSWLTAISGQLKPSQKVGDVLTEAQVAALYRPAR